MRKLLGIVVVILLVFGLGGTAAAAEPTTVYLINTLDRVVVDVYVDGNLIIEDFAPDTIRGPFVGEANGELWIEMIPANTVLGEPNQYLTNAVLVTSLPAGQTVAIVAQRNNIPGAMGTLTMFAYDLARTGSGQARLMVHNALVDDDIEVTFFPGTANEQVFSAGEGFHFQTSLPAGSTTASLILWGRDPAPEVIGTFTADLQPGKLYVVFIYRKLSGIQVLRQEFNVGQ